MTKGKIKLTLKKSLAVLASLTLLMSCFSAELITTASAGENDADKIYIYDEYGNELKDFDPVYIDNSSAAGQKTETFVTVKLVNSSGALNDSLITQVPQTSTPTLYTESKKESEEAGSATYKIVIKGYTEEDVTWTDPVTEEQKTIKEYTPLTPGTSKVTFLSSSGSMLKNINVITQEPATDMMIYYDDNRTFPLAVNDNNFFNNDLKTSIEGKKKQFDYSLITPHPNAEEAYLDKVEWAVYDINDNGTINYDSPSTRAEITENGVFTGNHYGPVMVVAKFKETAAAEINYQAQLKAYNAGRLTTAPVRSSDRLGAVGSKTYSFYKPKIQDGKVVEGEFELNSDGTRRVTTVSSGNLVPEFTSYTVSDVPSGTDKGKKVINGSLILNNGLPTYKTIENVPKYIRVVISKNNPAKDVKFDTDIVKFSDPDNQILALNPNAGIKLEIKATPTFTQNDGSGYFTAGVTDDWSWSSSAPDIVSVDQNGNIKALKKGQATITVQSEDQKNISASCTVIVQTLADSLNIVDMTTNSVTNSVTTRVSIENEVKAVLDPTNANEKVEWISENPTIATVSPKISGGSSNEAYASIKGVKPGSTYIVATTEYSKRTVRILVTVNDKFITDKISVSTQQGSERFQFTDANNTRILYTNKDMTIDAELTSSTGSSSDDQVVWAVKDPDDHVTYTIDNTTKHLKLHGMTEGNVEITASSKDKPAKKQTFVIKVLKSAATASIVRADDKTTAIAKNGYLCLGGMLEMDAVMKGDDYNFPDNHSDKIIKWYTSDATVAAFDNGTDKLIKEYVAEVDNTGAVVPASFPCKLKAIKEGTAQITVTTASGVTDKLTVNVFSAQSVTLTNVKTEGNKLVDTINMNDSLVGSKTFSATVKDQNGNNVSPVELEWSSSNESVATISPSGVATAQGVGKTTITVKAGNRSQNCELTVYAPMTAVITNEPENFIYTPTKAVYTQDIKKLDPIIGGVKLTEGKDFTVDYKHNDAIGKATMTLTGMGYYISSQSFSFNIDQRPITDSGIDISYVERHECTGEYLYPELTIICDGIALEKDTDYYVTYSNNWYPGTATMTIKGNGKYSDSVDKEFTIFCDHKVLTNSTILKKPTYEEEGLEIGTCAACGDKDIQKIIPKIPHSDNPATSISFKQPAEFGVERGETLDLNEQLIAIASDKTKAATDTFRWESQDTNIVTVDDGVIKGISNGKTTVTVYGENTGVEATCEIAVIYKVTAIETTPTTAETRVGVAAEVNADITPYGYSDEIIWESANTAIATVTPSEEGAEKAIITGVSVGQTTVTVRGRYSGIEAVVNVNVGARRESDVIGVSTVINDIPTLIPNSTADSMYTYRMYSNQDVTFDAVISNSSGITADDVAVWEITGNDGDTITLPDYGPSDDKITNSLLIHGASLGTATVTVYPQRRPELKTSFKIEVAKRCDIIDIKDPYDYSVSSRSLNVDDTLMLHADLTTNDPNYPYDHGDEVLGWTTSDPEVAVVDAMGVVTAKKNGSAVITMSTRSAQTKTVTIYVFTTSNVYLTSGVEKPENPGDLPSASIKVNSSFEGTKTLGATVYDENEASVSNVTCKWTSSDESIATVDHDGVVTAVNVGKVIITVKSGAKTESCEVTITAPMTAMVFDPIDDYVFDPNKTEYSPDPVITMGPTTLVKDVDYTVEYSDNTAPGRASVTFTGLGYYEDTNTIYYYINKRALTDENVKITPIADQDYTGEAITPKVHVSCLGVDLVEDTDYTVSYTDNTEPGTATVTIYAAYSSGYEGEATLNFNIVKNYIGYMGDIDGDETPTSTDALMILRSTLGMEEFTPDQQKLADVNKDNAVDATDSLLVLRYSVGFSDPDVYIGEKRLNG